LTSHRFPLGFRHVVHEEDVRVLVVHRERIDVNDPFLWNELLQNPSMTLEKAAVDHDDLVRVLDPRRHRGIRNEEGLGVTAAREGWHFLRDQIPGKARDFAADARSFARQDGDRLRRDLLHRVRFTGRARALDALNLQ
jgi:hypothetical protein